MKAEGDAEWGSMFGTFTARRQVETTWITLLAVAASMLVGVAGSRAATHGETCTDVIVVLDESGLGR